MPFIPTIVSQESVRVGGIDVYADASQAGARIGRATQALGGAIKETAETLAYLERREEAERKQRKSDEDRLAVAQAVAQTDIGRPAMEVQRDAPADGSGIGAETTKRQKELIDKTADEMFPNDSDRRAAYKIAMYQKLPGWRDRATGVEFTQAEGYYRQETNNSINALINKVRTDPMRYDEAMEDAKLLIASGNYPDAAKTVMYNNLQSDAAGARFEAFMNAASSDDDFVRLQSELKDDFWRKQMTPEKYDQTVQGIATAHGAFLSGQDAKARSILDSMDTRSKAREIIPDLELRELSAFVRNAKSPAINNRYANLISQQSLLRTYGKASPAQLDQVIKHQRENPEVKGVVGRWASDASQVTNGEISASYMISKLGIEYSADDIRAGRFNVKNKAGTSSAGGIMQFIDGTWISMMQKYGSRFGYEPSRMTPSQMLALRDDPGLSMKMGALYALENKRAMQAAGINPDDTDLYLAHFLGAGGAISFIQARRADPNGPARPYGDFSQKQIEANWSVFRKNVSGGKSVAKSYSEVYADLSRKMTPGTTAAQFSQIEYIEQMRDSKREAVRNDPVVQYIADGRMGDYELDSYAAMATRGADAAGAANYYNIPINEMKPLTNEEATAIKARIASGDADTQLRELQTLAGLDAGAPGMFAAAMAQLGEKDTVLGYAATLAYDKGDEATAAVIVRGANIIKTDKSLDRAFGSAGDADDKFYTTVGRSLSGIAPAARDAIFNAAKAHYAETYASRGNLTFDGAQFEASVNAVLGSNGTGGPSLGSVNDVQTVLPRGVTEDMFETALSNMTDSDFASMSLEQVPPKDVFGEPVTADAIADEGAFVWIGRNQYKVQMSDGNYLTTGTRNERTPYSLNAYVFIASPQMLRKLSQTEETELSPAPAETAPNVDPQTGKIVPGAAAVMGLQ